ncbi:hypothetical protein BGK72_15565 [Streptomyces agglomeratus]|nr:hypothetical protein BGK72_15565 [Streptomyces agglomeratus]
MLDHGIIYVVHENRHWIVRIPFAISVIVEHIQQIIKQSRDYLALPSLHHGQARTVYDVKEGKLLDDLDLIFRSLFYVEMPLLVYLNGADCMEEVSKQFMHESIENFPIISCILPFPTRRQALNLLILLFELLFVECFVPFLSAGLSKFEEPIRALSPHRVERHQATAKVIV